MVDGTCVEMLEKRKHRSDNTSGFRGVYQLRNGKYRATIGFKGKRFYIGTFVDYQDAVQARQEAESTITKALSAPGTAGTGRQKKIPLGQK